MLEKVQEINKLAKTLQESGIAKTSEEAMKMAEEMINKREETIKGLTKEQESEGE